MKIFVKQIPETGMSIDQTVTSKDLDLPSELLFCVAPLAIHGEFEHVGDEVLARITVRGKYRLSCVKCLDEFEIEKTDRFNLVFDIEPGTECFDFTGDVRDELILAVSLNPVCRDNCKGLCLDCGVNLNSEKCKCSSSN